MKTLWRGGLSSPRGCPGCPGGALLPSSSPCSSAWSLCLLSPSSSPAQRGQFQKEHGSSTTTTQVSLLQQNKYFPRVFFLFCGTDLGCEPLPKHSMEPDLQGCSPWEPELWIPDLDKQWPIIIGVAFQEVFTGSSREIRCCCEVLTR